MHRRLSTHTFCPLTHINTQVCFSQSPTEHLVSFLSSVNFFPHSNRPPSPPPSAFSPMTSKFALSAYLSLYPAACHVDNINFPFLSYREKNWRSQKKGCVIVNLIWIPVRPSHQPAPKLSGRLYNTHSRTHSLKVFLLHRNAVWHWG